MGWMKTIIRFALSISVGFLDIYRPLGLSLSNGCQYPNDWQSCNTPTSRDCWIRKDNTESNDESVSQFDILTDCE